MLRLLGQAMPMVGQAQKGGSRLLAGSHFGLPEHFLGLFPIKIRSARCHRLVLHDGPSRTLPD